MASDPSPSHHLAGVVRHRNDEGGWGIVDAPDQDGFQFAATALWRDGEPRTEPVGSSDPSGAYRSTLTITLQDGTVLFDETAHEHVRRTADER